MTLAERPKKEGFEQGIQQGVEQGLLQGLMEGIEMAVSLKFPEVTYKIMPLIRQMDTISQLKIDHEIHFHLRACPPVMQLVIAARIITLRCPSACACGVSYKDAKVVRIPSNGMLGLKIFA
jgi:hypothetical protein